MASLMQLHPLMLSDFRDGNLSQGLSSSQRCCSEAVSIRRGAPSHPDHLQHTPLLGGEPAARLWAVHVLGMAPSHNYTW